MNEPWSKRHKLEFQNCQYNLSNSFAQPLSQPELLQYTQQSLQNDPSAAASLLSLYHQHDLTYVPNGGSLDLRRDIARVVYRDRLSADDILLFPGGQVALQTASLAFARDGCHSVVFTPGYQSTVESPLWAPRNGGLTRIARRPESRWQVDPREVRAAMRENTRFVIWNEPWNPGGTVATAELQREMIEICRANEAVLLCDEVYRLLEHDGDAVRLDPVAVAYEKGISAVTVSKPWGGCGISIGWLACRDRNVIRRLADVQYFGTACVSRASEIQARMVLASSDAILKDRLEIIRKNKELLREFVEERYGEWFSWIRPTAGAIAFVEFRGPWTAEELGRRLAAEGISIKPAYCFVAEVTPDLERYFRVGFGERKMPLALEALARFVESHKHLWRESGR
ncbi:hypothetical protein ACHAXS_011316 [Conticribra weissflogii]